MLRVRPAGPATLAIGVIVLVGPLGPPRHERATPVAGPRALTATGITEAAAGRDADEPETDPVARSVPESGPGPVIEVPREASAAAPLHPCAEALEWVSGAGLVLPAGVDYHCPSSRFAHHGAACWDAWPCPGRAFVSINTDLIGDAGTRYLHHVVAHEICHILDFQATGKTTEAGADACAAAHGAPA